MGISRLPPHIKQGPITFQIKAQIKAMPGNDLEQEQP